MNREPGISRKERISEEGLQRLERQLARGAKMSPRILEQWVKRYGEAAEELMLCRRSVSGDAASSLPGKCRCAVFASPRNYALRFRIRVRRPYDQQSRDSGLIDALAQWRFVSRACIAWHATPADT